MVSEILRPKELFKQIDNQGCLFACFCMMRTAYKPEERIDYSQVEKKLYDTAYALYPNYALAKSAAFVRTFPDTKLTFFVDNDEHAPYLKGINEEEAIAIQQQNINSDWVLEQVNLGNPLTVYVDKTQLPPFELAHDSHFVLIYQEEKGEAYYADPNFGKAYKLSPEQLEYSIGVFKYLMNWSPVAIGMEVR